MNDLNRIKYIFETEGFDVFSANGGEVILVYLPNTFNYQGRLMTISFDEFQEGKCLFVKFKVLSKNYRPRMGFDYEKVTTDLKELTEEELTNKVHNLMENAKICEKLIYEAKRVNKIHKDF